jgi:hypothetical protein
MVGETPDVELARRDDADESSAENGLLQIRRECHLLTLPNVSRRCAAL